MKLYFVIFWLCFKTKNVVLAEYTDINWQTAVGLSDYKAYSSIRMLQFRVPVMASQSVWFFNPLKNGDPQCEDRTIIVVLQHGSYPVINPLNETFPPNFYLDRTDLHVITMDTTLTVQEFMVLHPLPGNWYGVAFLGDYVDDSIKQKGIGPSCGYLVGSELYVRAYDTIEQVIVDEWVSLDTNFTQGTSLYRFHTREHSFKYTVKVDNCTVYPNPNTTTWSGCPLIVTSRALGLPHPDVSSSHTVNCSEYDGVCDMSVVGEATNDWHYIGVLPDVDARVEFSIMIELEDCTRYINEDEKETSVFNNTSYLLSNGTHNLTCVGNQNDSICVENISLLSSSDERSASPDATQCVRVPELGRYEQASSPFKVEFALRISLIRLPNQISIPEKYPYVLKFDILPMLDVGGTLTISVDLLTEFVNDTTQIVTISTCIQRQGIPVNNRELHCSDDVTLISNSSRPDMEGQNFIRFPYPEPGPWFVALIATCYALDGVTVEPCRQASVAANFAVNVMPCVDDRCGEYGNCRQYYSSIHHFSTCGCMAGYRGYGCTDDTYAQSDSYQLTATLLLTISNLAFIPAIVVSIYRRFYVEALVYTFTMFFSTFYHACDGSRKHLYCMMPYGVMAHCDFFGAILSVWVTLIAMARLKEKIRTFLLTLGCLGLAMGVTWDRFSLWTFMVPAITSAIIMFTSWGIRCHHRKKCYPSIRRWLIFLIPGILVAAAGLITFAFFETESNYQYTHSVWHACMFLCVVLLLPPRETQTDGKVEPNKDEVPLVIQTSISDPNNQTNASDQNQQTVTTDITHSAVIAEETTPGSRPNSAIRPNTADRPYSPFRPYSNQNNGLPNGRSVSWSESRGQANGHVVTLSDGVGDKREDTFVSVQF